MRSAKRLSFVLVAFSLAGAARAESPRNVFAGILLPEALRPAFGRAQEALALAGAEVAWSPLRDLHVTLQFYGELDEPRRATLREQLRAVAARHRAFDLKYRGLGTFAFKDGTVRVIWGRPRGALDRLSRLAVDVAGTATAAGARRGDEDFTPHVTLGRVRSQPKGSSLPRAIAGQSRTEFGRQRVTAFALLESGGPGGYRVLESFPLGDGR